MKRFSEWSDADVALHNSRVSPANKIPVPADAVEDESELHADIRAECRRRGWLCFGGDMSHRTRRVAGEPDFIIAAHGGVTLWIECKSRTGKSTPAQIAIGYGLTRLNHRHAVIRSMSDFIALAT